MNLLRLLSVLSAAFASQHCTVFAERPWFAAPLPTHAFGRQGGPRGGGCSLTGPKKQFIRKPPAGYWSQVTPDEHLHSAARRRREDALHA